MIGLDQGLVLVVDDHEAGRYLAMRTLQGAGYRTLEAATGREGLALARKEKPDVVLLDIKLPDIDGFEVCRLLRADPETSSMTIVQMSATFETPEYQVRGLEGGADTYLVEPVEPTLLVATVRAMSRLRRAETELREFDRRKDEFLATVAHELRNPLAPLRSSLDLLEEDALDPRVLRECVAVMRRQTDHLIRLVDDLADISRITQDKLTLRLDRVDLKQVLQSAIESRGGELKSKGQEVAVDLPTEPVQLYADGVRLSQVFNNLLSNCIKYTPKGGLVEIIARLESDGVCVQFKDNGEGIAPSNLGKIFDLFVQVGAQGSGLGIGLALVNRIVQMHGGSIEAASAGIGHGSTFTIRLPASMLAGATPQPEKFSPAHSERRKSGRHGDSQVASGAAERPAEPKKILVVDDNVDAADSLTSLLNAMGHEVRTCYGGEEALSSAAKFRPDVVFMDITMPGLDGLQTIERIKQQPWSERVLIYTVSGHGRAHGSRAIAAGADRHLVKPLGRAEIEGILSRG